MDWTKLDITSVLEILTTIMTIGSIGFGYKILIYDAHKKAAEVRTEANVAEKIGEEAEIAKIQAVNVLINASKELVQLYKDIIGKLEITIKEQEVEKAAYKKERDAFKKDMEDLIISRDGCMKEISLIRKTVEESQAKIKILEAQLNSKEN